MSIDTEFTLSAPPEITSAREYGQDAVEAEKWAERGTAAAALKAAHILALMAASGHPWTADQQQARLDSLQDRGREAELLREAATRASAAGWPDEVGEHMRRIADEVAALGVGSSPNLTSDDGRMPATPGLYGISQQAEAPHSWERFTGRAAHALHIAKDFEHHEIKTARDHRHAQLQARAAEEEDAGGSVRASRIYERMADCGHPWEKNRELAKVHAKDDRREQGYSLFAAARQAAENGSPDREVKRLYTRAYGVLTAAGEPEPDLRVWLWPDGGEDARYNLALARCYVRLGRYEEAERRAERAIWQKLIDAPYLSNHDRAVIENMGMRLVRDEGISGIDC